MFSGGEPLLRPDCERLIAAAREHRARTVLTTNGSLLTPGRAASLRRAGLDLAQVPILSNDPATHDRLSGARCFEVVIGHLIALRELDLPIVPVFVATSDNLDHFPEVLKLCRILRFQTVIFNRYLPAPGKSARADALVVSDAAIARSLGLADRFAMAQGMRIVLGTPSGLDADAERDLRSVHAAGCPLAAGGGKLTIGPDGALRPCGHSRAALGNALDGDIVAIARRFARDGRDGGRKCRLADGDFASVPGHP